MFDILATAAPTESSGQLGQILPWVSTFVVGVLGAVLRSQAKNQGIAEGKKRVQIEPQPLMVMLQEEFVRRGEFKDLKDGLSKLEGLLAATNEKVERKHLELLATIELAAKTGRDGRVALWDELKPMGKQLAALTATSDVANQLGKLADSLKQARKSNGQ
jgi:hypothetical protein